MVPSSPEMLVDVPEVHVVVMFLHCDICQDYCNQTADELEGGHSPASLMAARFPIDVVAMALPEDVPNLLDNPVVAHLEVHHQFQEFWNQASKMVLVL